MQAMRNDNGKSAKPGRFCARCGEPGPFRSDKALLCNSCIAERDERERQKANVYFRARNRAMGRLREEFADRWEELLKEEKAKERRRLRVR